MTTERGTKVKVTTEVRCPECKRVFDLLNETDAAGGGSAFPWIF